MGGDHAPAEIVRGAVRAARRGGVHVTLVGDPERVEAELSRHDASGLPIGVAPSQGVITEGESPVVAARQQAPGLHPRLHRTREGGHGRRLRYNGVYGSRNGRRGRPSWND